LYSRKRCTGVFSSSTPFSTGAAILRMAGSAVSRFARSPAQWLRPSALQVFCTRYIKWRSQPNQSPQIRISTPVRTCQSKLRSCQTVEDFSNS
jgi:hypothetical protein